MYTFDEMIDFFNSKGLYTVQRNEPERPNALMIAGRVKEIRLGDDRMNILNDITYIYVDNVGWTFEIFIGAIPYSLDDVVLNGLSSEDAIAKVLDYYFGKPLIIDNWIFPIHKHPDWDRVQLIETVKRAKPISVTAWEGIKTECDKRFQQIIKRDISLWNRYPELLFIPFDNVENDQTKLWMRRDCKKMYIVT